MSPTARTPSIGSPNEPASRRRPGRLRIVVVGDALLDRDLLGEVDRLCPDAPVPVVEEREQIERPGGAGLAAVLAARAGADVDVTLVCALADDPAGRRLRRLLREHDVDVLSCVDDGSTAEKTRVRVDARSIVRLDRGARGRLGPLPNAATAMFAAADAVLCADYGRGVLAHAPVRWLVMEAVRRGVPTVWDPHPRGGAPIEGVTLAVPNANEAERFDDSRAALAGLPAAADRAQRLRARWACGAVAVKLGARGAVVAIGGGSPLVVPVAEPAHATDTCGAGDAFAAHAVVALARGAVVSEAVSQAVEAATAFVVAGGAATVGGPGDPPAPATSPASARRTTLVAAGGCFDVLHAGHVATLEAARALGDRLVVLLNSDASVSRLKGAGRPVQHAADRAAVLRSLRCVDDVIVFDEDTPVEALRRLQPDVFVKGGDYTAAELPETAVLAEWGGVVVTAPYLAGRSTSHLIDQISRDHSREHSRGHTRDVPVGADRVG